MKRSNAWWHLGRMPWSTPRKCWPWLSGAPNTGKLQESFPMPYVLRWLRMPELMQTMMPLRGELPLIPSGTHLEDIHIHSPATWAWIAVLLQHWQDHMTRQLYGGHFQQASDLENTLICDINPWLPHSVHFGWNYMATHATLWLDMWDQFTDEHHTEWEGQKLLTHSLNNLECNTEVIYPGTPREKGKWRVSGQQ